MSNAAVLDTSWLLELYRVPGDFEKSRTHHVQKKTKGVIKAGCELFVTVPVLFEVASHVTHVRDGHRRRALGKKFIEDIESSFLRERPWTIVAVRENILLRVEDFIRLANRFLQESGPNYSFANISIIDLAKVLRRKGRTVEILSFHDELKSYSG